MLTFYTTSHPAKVGYFRIDSFGEASRIKAPDFSLIGTIRKGVPGMILARLMSAGTRRRGKEHSLSGTPVADCRTRFYPPFRGERYFSFSGVAALRLP